MATTTFKQEMRRALFERLDTDSVLKDLLIEWEDVDYENTEEFISLSLLAAESQDIGDNYSGTFQIDCVSKKRASYSLDIIEDLVKSLLNKAQFLTDTTYSVVVHTCVDNPIDPHQSNLTFSFYSLETAF